LSRGTGRILRIVGERQIKELSKGYGIGTVKGSGRRSAAAPHAGSEYGSVSSAPSLKQNHSRNPLTGNRIFFAKGAKALEKPMGF